MSVAAQVVKKFINDPDNVVPEALAGIAAAHPGLVRVDLENQLVIRADAPVQGKVGLVSGGGSGHEPLHGGFVGLGMLDAACAGAVFTSPVPDQMAAASKAVDGGAGVLHIVKNYTGDVLNFKMGAELAEDEGVEVASVLMDDDVAVQDSLYTAGRRGVGATVLAEKLAGARAEAGGSLAEVADVAKKVNDRARSFGVALSSCATPSSGGPIFDLGPDEIEVGVGIHGEPGRRRAKHAPAKEIVEMMLEPILEDLRPQDGTKVLAFVNGLGGTPLLELYLLFNEVNLQLGDRGVSIARSLVGNYITSLEMAGASITLLTLDDQLTALWDAPVQTAALRWGR
ncbi:MAG: phosphoenolpyruvate---glycerone phosphotransferase subunit DhaK [Gaiellales bacterium]|nr:phosphoenolpyruvate---glycerone phosphotransferase subunit DhaK [Gaiellales bacterium]